MEVQTGLPSMVPPVARRHQPLPLSTREIDRVIPRGHRPTTHLRFLSVLNQRDVPVLPLPPAPRKGSMLLQPPSNSLALRAEQPQQLQRRTQVLVSREEHVLQAGT